MECPLSVVGFDQCASNRNLSLRLLGQRDAHRVADALIEQRADADGRFDPPVLSVAGLRHAEMNGVVHPALSHPLSQQAIGLQNDHGVRGLHGENQIAIPVGLADQHELQRRFHHPLRSVAIAIHDPVRERAVIGPDAHAHAELFGAPDQRGEDPRDSLQLR